MKMTRKKPGELDGNFARLILMAQWIPGRMVTEGLFNFPVRFKSDAYADQANTKYLKASRFFTIKLSTLKVANLCLSQRISCWYQHTSPKGGTRGVAN